MITTFLVILFYLLAPAAVVWACTRVKFLGKIGPVLVLYILGVLVTNLRILPQDIEGLQNSLSEILVPLAIPMMLFGCDFKNFSAKHSLLSFIIGVFSVLLMVSLGFILVGDKFGAEGPIMGAALTGLYTGGSGNLAAVKLMLGMDNTTFVLLSTCDIIICFIYLLFLMGGGIKLARKFIGVNTSQDNQEIQLEASSHNPYKDFGKKSSILQLLKILGAAALITVISLGLTKLFKEEYFMIVIILSLSTISLLLSFTKEVRTWDKSYDAGMYLIYIFCLVMASMADLSKIDLQSSLFILVFQAFVIFGSYILMLVLARILKIDADTTVITSNTLINSPITVPMIAASMKNKNAIIPGITNGVVGFAVGNYLAFLIYQLLSTL